MSERGRDLESESVCERTSCLCHFLALGTNPSPVALVSQVSLAVGTRVVLSPHMLL